MPTILPNVTDIKKQFLAQKQPTKNKEVIHLFINDINPYIHQYFYQFQEINHNFYNILTTTKTYAYWSSSITL